MWDWGDVPTWVTAFIALGGVLYAGFNLRALRVRNLKAQGSSVYLTTSRLEPVPHSTGMRISARVTNGSDKPVRHVTIRLHQFGSYLSSLTEPIIEPNSTWEWVSDEVLVAHEKPIASHARINFTDNDGYLWMRFEGAHLVPAYRSHNEKWRTSPAGRAFRQVVPRTLRRAFRDRYRMSRFRQPVRAKTRWF